MNMKEIIETSMKNLAKQKMIFCSEGDFQYHLANAIKEQDDNLEIFLEYRRVDICVYDKTEKQKYFIELKYKKSKLDCERNGMKYSLRNHGAQNDNRHAFFKDINKLENIEEDNLKCSFALFLTNDHLYWPEKDKKKGKEENQSLGESFCIDTKISKGTHKYDERTKNKSEVSTASIEIENTYRCEWVQYLPEEGEPTKNGELFKYLLLQVPPKKIRIKRKFIKLKNLVRS